MQTLSQAVADLRQAEAMAAQLHAKVHSGGFGALSEPEQAQLCEVIGRTAQGSADAIEQLVEQVNAALMKRA